MIKAIEQIDIAGRGVMDVFNEYLPVTYIANIIDLPNLNADGNHRCYFDFDVPAEIAKNPFFWVEEPNREIYMTRTGLWSPYYYTYFTQLSDTRWRLNVQASGYRSATMNWTPLYANPIIKSGARLVIGGYRG